MTSQSWFERMSESFQQCLAGIVLIIFSFPVLWINERRNAKMQSLLALGESECVSVASNKAEVDNRGTLVHINDGRTRATAEVSDARFRDASIKSGCLRLCGEIEVYQNVEHVKSRQQRHMGGRVETIQETTYELKWSSTR